MQVKLEVKKEIVTVQAFKGRNGVGIVHCVEGCHSIYQHLHMKSSYDDCVGWIIYHSVQTQCYGYVHHD